MGFFDTSIINATLTMPDTITIRRVHDPIPENYKCQNCKEHSATEKFFTREVSALDISHGAAPEYWCEHCVLNKQLEHSKSEIARLAKWIPELESKIKALECK